MRVVVKEPGKPPETRDIPNELGDLQAIVGGYIENIPGSPAGFVLLGNEDGRMMGLAPSLRLPVGTIVGSVVMAAGPDRKGDLISMTDAQVVTATRWLEERAV